MKTTSLLLSAAISLAGASAFGQPIVARGRVQLINSGCPTELCKPALVPMEQAARAGNAGTVLFSGDCSRMRLSPGSEFELYGGEAPATPVFEAPLEHPEATSAIKSINTQRIAERFFNEAKQRVTHDGVLLRSGSLLVDQRSSAIDVRVLKATLRGANTRFSVAAVSPCSARVTVAQGTLGLLLPGELPRTLRPGEFVELNTDAYGRTLAGDPRLISESALARADERDLARGMASRLAPVGECVDLAGDLEPVGELISPAVGAGPTVPFDIASETAPAVGAGPTVPFDIASETAPAVGAGPTVPFDIGVPSVGTGPTVPFDLPRIRSAANKANTSGPVVSPAVP